jgi:hypothetical protein
MNPVQGYFPPNPLDWGFIFIFFLTFGERLCIFFCFFFLKSFDALHLASGGVIDFTFLFFSFLNLYSTGFP